ncbi:MAG: RagB/SusD family nutrient uptake outer membrane protein [Balneolales bacterium]|nr:RagB/SusD family nutrient uptake outer membrane protein [Balneolales bacterium]
MKKFNLTKVLSISALALLFGFACTDLTEKLPSELTDDSFFQTEEEFIAALGDAYTVLGAWQNHGGLFALNEVSTDAVAIPVKGADWDDGGIWVDAHRHTINSEHGPTNGSWNFLFSGVSNTNRLISQFQTAVENGSADPALAEEFIGELRAMRAFYYYFLLDNFGNVPIIDDFINTPAQPANNPDFQAGRNQVFEFVESELLATADLISDDPRASYGRFHKYAAHFLLAKLYMNAEVYTGTARWADAETQLDIIIDSGLFSLTDNFFANFATANSSSPETIFAIPYDSVFLPGFNMHHMTLHYGHQRTFNFQDQPWNGYTTLQAFYESFEEDDVRREGFLIGPQFDASGNPLIDNEIAEGHELVLTKEIQSIRMDTPLSRQMGARFAKFEYAPGSSPDLDNDFPVFRHGDVILMKAEAMWRQGNGGEMYFNMIRDRAGVSPITLNGPNLLAERGRELYTEIWRRQDLIRFDGNQGGVTAFNDPWWEKDVSPSFRNVFPIPFNQIQANPNLTQNPGY